MQSCSKLSLIAPFPPTQKCGVCVCEREGVFECVCAKEREKPSELKRGQKQNISFVSSL